VDDNSVGWHNKFCVFSKAADLASILLELRGFRYGRCKDLYVAAL
jgi:hypothetical protein